MTKKKKGGISKLLSVRWLFGLLEVKKIEGLKFITKMIGLTLISLILRTVSSSNTLLEWETVCAREIGNMVRDVR